MLVQYVMSCRTYFIEFHVNNPKSPLPIALIIHIQLKKVCELQKAFSCNHCVKQNFN